MAGCVSDVMGVVRKVATVALLGCLATSSTGCKSLLKKQLGADGGATNAAMSSQDIADEQLQEKLDEYIKCLNSLSTQIHKSRRSYLSYIPKAGPKGTERDVQITKLKDGATASCTVGAAKSKTMPPSDAKLEGAGQEFADAAAAVDKQVNDAFSYFDMKAFKDDKWAKGKALHPQLMQAFDRFSKADKSLHDTLDGITKPLAQRVLARIEREEGKKFRYGRKKVLITSRELVEAADPTGEDPDVDFTLYQSTYNEFEKALDELTAYGSMHKAELGNQKLAPNWPMADSNYEQFVRSSTDYKKAAKEFWRCLRDAPPRSKSPSGKIDREKMGNCGSDPAWKLGESTVRAYNEFIRTSNAHQFP
jgi:Protein of unknown function (DUF3829)